MPPVEQQVKIIATFYSKLEGVNRAISQIDKLRQANIINGAQQKRMTEVLKRSDVGIFNTAMKLRKYKDEVTKAKKAQQEATASARKMTGSYLSLMFTGMALTRVFGGMVRSVLDIMGVSEMWQATLITVLLPALEPLVDILYTVMDWFMDLPEGMQKAIGFFVLLAAGIGYVMMIVGMWGTFMAGGAKVIGSVFGGLWTKVLQPVFGWIGKGLMFLWQGVLVPFVSWVAGALGVSFGAAFAIIAAVIVAVVALVVGAIVAWKNNFLGFRDAVIGIWEAIKQYFTGIVQFWKGIWDIIVGIFTLNGDKIKQGFSGVIEGIKNMFKGMANFVINIINSLVGLIIAALAQLIRPIQWIWNKIPGHAKATWYEDIMASGAGKNLIPSFKTGGVMPYTGLAMLHAGETITPTGQTQTSNSFAPSITINATIANDYDVKKLATELNKYWVKDFERISKARGTI